ncbi:unnamed protein product [Nyctereutes procyonoides]|uniref:(raccoon dog) hypothetical protein n=1 Tax=Nyctereutes procyonoides TaxID=34880 RepID=A0A811XZV8_NYCPR|nr:unnamed protein product [Nyctereutes procyonoides]
MSPSLKPCSIRSVAHFLHWVLCGWVDLATLVFLSPFVLKLQLLLPLTWFLLHSYDFATSLLSLIKSCSGLICRFLSSFTLSKGNGVNMSDSNNSSFYQEKLVGFCFYQLLFLPPLKLIIYVKVIFNAPEYNIVIIVLFSAARAFFLGLEPMAKSPINTMCLPKSVIKMESYFHKGDGGKGCHEQPTGGDSSSHWQRRNYTPNPPLHDSSYLMPTYDWNTEQSRCRVWKVSPDRADLKASNEYGDIKHISTKEWAMIDDIQYLLTMDKLWWKRKPPVLLDWAEVRNQEETDESDQQNELQLGLQDQQVLEMTCLQWVTSAADLMLLIFSMNMKSRFGRKLMAENIIPAIATTNGVIAGLRVLEGLKTLLEKKKLPVPWHWILTIPIVRHVPTSQSDWLNIHKMTVLPLQDKIAEANNHNKLSEFGTGNGSLLQADDFLQNYTLLINILHSPKQTEDDAKSISNGSDDGAQPSTSTSREHDNAHKVTRGKWIRENISAKRPCAQQTEELDNVTALD